MLSEIQGKQKFIGFFAGEFFKNSLVHWLLIGVVFLNVANWTVLAIFVRPVDFPVYLHYNVYLGVDQSMTGSWRDIFLLPSTGLFFLVLNSFLAFHLFYHKERIASYMLLLAAIMVQVAAITASVAAVLINYL